MPRINDVLEPSPTKVILTVILIIFGLIILWGSFFVVNPGEQALVFSSFTGLNEQVYGEGMHLKMPIFEGAIKMNIRVQKQQETTSSASKDLQDVTTEVAVNFQIDKTQIVDIYRRIGKATVSEDYMQSQIMNPIIQESVKSVTARYTAEELITQRPKVKIDIDTIIKERMASYNIIVTDVSITNFKFSDVFTKAIEEKVTAEQNALKEQNNLKVVEFQAQQKVAQSKGESQAIEIINEQLIKSPQYINYITIQKWDGKMPLALGSGSLLSITGAQKED
jgi:regulator of protease activity HflC (stomatin/prohibitin superfamily)